MKIHLIDLSPSYLHTLEFSMAIQKIAEEMKRLPIDDLKFFGFADKLLELTRADIIELRDAIAYKNEERWSLRRKIEDIFGFGTQVEPIYELLEKIRHGLIGYERGELAIHSDFAFEWSGH